VFEAERGRLIERLVRSGYLRSDKVIEAMAKVPRHRFLPEDVGASAYADRPLSIGLGQTISAPHMVAIMTELLGIEPDSCILEVGTGSGYQAAVLAELAPEGHVYSVERIRELATRANASLQELNYGNVEVMTGDGTLGWAKHAPYDRIMITAASPTVPKPLVDQLSDGGRLLIPVGGRWSQTLIEVCKDEVGVVDERRHGGCVFVPLVGEKGW
jgi:protein-L-isoaspartate(D-aspartate) O-methyltransferase